MATKCPKCHTDNPDSSLYCSHCATSLKPSTELSVTKTLEAPIEELTQGTTFAGRYEIIEELGKGGMGRVYKALDREINEKVAVKLLKPEIAEDGQIIERFRNELKIARKVSHKNVCRMHDIGRESSKYYITMECVEGKDLKSLVRETKRIPEKEAIRIAKQVCEGLNEAHRLGVIHRDLKPQNIMIDKEGNAKIMDFGIARSLWAPGVTKAGMMIGTPDYISPEQAEGEEADQRSDIYSLGVILFEMVTGTLPFKGDTALSVALKHKTKIPLDPRQLNPEISDSLNRLILVCMEKERGRRYQTAEALLDDLRNVEEGLPLGTKIRPRRESFVRALARKKLLIPAAVAVLAIAIVIIWQFLPKKGAPATPKIENSIAVISFENQTGDKTYDYLREAIPNLIITNLEQTGEFYVATWERMHDILRQMGKGEVGTVNRDLGFAACQREGIGAIVLGSYIKAGDIFATDVKVLDVESKKLLKSYDSRGNGIDSILATQIDELCRGIAQGMGRKTVEAEQLKVADVTTSSMEAYQYYLKGRDAYEGENFQEFQEAIQNLNQAIEIDPEFASAYLKLGEAYNDIGNGAASNDAIKKASSLSSKVTEKERLYIQAMVEAKFLGEAKDSEKQLGLIQQLAEKYPKDKRAYYYLGRYYQNQLNWDKAIEEFKKGLELDPQFAPFLLRLPYSYLMKKDYLKAIEAFKRLIAVRPYDANAYCSLGDPYYLLGDFEKAIESNKKAWEVQPGFGWAGTGLSYLYALSEDYVEAMRWIDEAIQHAQSAQDKGNALGYKAFYLFWLGCQSKALATLDQALEFLKAAGNEMAIDGNASIRFLFYYHKGELELAKKLSNQLLDIGTEDYLRYYSGYPNYIKGIKLEQVQRLGMIEIKEGRTETAKKWLAEAKPFFIDQTWGEPKVYYLLIYKRINAEVLISEGRYDDSIAILNSLPVKQPPFPYQGIELVSYNLEFLQDALARAYQLKGDIDRAISEYERLIVVDPKRKERYLVHPTYHYRLGILYEQKGQKNKAVKEYRKFLQLWKDADPDWPELEDAKKRLAGLT